MPPCGIENGLCEKSTFFSSSFHSYNGKSTIQQKFEAVLVDQVQLLADAVRAARELVEPSDRRRRRRRRRRP
jgi:exo-beta-1,3-glucanase (GH17 family)